MAKVAKSPAGLDAETCLVESRPIRADWAFWEAGLKETGAFGLRLNRGAAAMHSLRTIMCFFTLKHVNVS